MSRTRIPDSINLSNPFLVESPDFKGKRMKNIVTVKVNGKTTIVSDDESIIEDNVYTRLYHHPYYREIMMNISHEALKLVYYIMYRLNHGKDYVWINKKSFKEEAHISNIKCNNAITELVNNGVIELIEGYSDVYFINPYLFFCGNRVLKYDNKTIRE